jgi:7-cyano-7-deazaguanine synthase
MTTRPETKIFALLSGGLDSTVALAKMLAEFNADAVAISMDYGQRHARELDAALDVAHYFGVDQRTIQIGGIIPPSMLTDKTKPLPNASYADLPHGISPTYVPFRNGLMLSILAAIAQGWVRDDEANRQAVIAFGAHAEDAQNWAYPDCTPEFIGPFGAAVFIGTYQKVRLVAPLMMMTKCEIVELGVKLNAPLSKTWSCYEGGEKHCGVCPTCRARKQAFRDAGEPDPTVYAA